MQSLPASLPVLSIMVLVPLTGAALLWAVPPLRRQARAVALVFSLAALAVGVWALCLFDTTRGATIQLAEARPWIPALGTSWALGVNALGLAMILLAAFLVPIVLLASWGEVPADRQALFSGLVLVLEAFMVVIFAARDVFLFYICFEAMLIPVYFLIGGFGGPGRRRAALKFLLYSLAGGLVMFLGVMALLVYGPGGETAYHLDTLAAGIAAPTGVRRWIFASFFIAFAIKAPMVPLHTWLPDTAEQATPGTSVLLIGVLDKIGTYGMISLVLPLFPEASAWAAPVIVVLAVVGIIYGGLAAIGQDHLYRLISYTSISHFGFMVLGIFVGSQVAATGAMVYMVAHGLSIAGLYLVTGFLARRTGTVSISELGGIARVMPLVAGTFLVSGLASIALPGLSGFVPEWMVLTGTFSVSVPLGVVAALGVVIAAVYVLLPYQRVFTGAPAPERVGGTDLDGREKLVLVPIIAAMLALGLAPAVVTDTLDGVAEQISTVTSQEQAASAALDVPTAEGTRQ